MKANNMSVEAFAEYIQDKDIYIYGVGDFYRRLTKSILVRKRRQSIGMKSSDGKGELL